MSLFSFRVMQVRIIWHALSFHSVSSTYAYYVPLIALSFYQNLQDPTQSKYKL